MALPFSYGTDLNRNFRPFCEIDKPIYLFDFFHSGRKNRFPLFLEIASA
jgi:hypothetical protein